MQHRGALLAATVLATSCREAPRPGAPPAVAPSSSTAPVPAEPAPLASVAPPSRPAPAASLAPPRREPSRPLEPLDDPKVIRDAAILCAELEATKRPGAHNPGSIAALAVFTRRMSELTFSYSQGDRQAACDIADLMRKAHTPACDARVQGFDASCRYRP